MRKCRRPEADRVWPLLLCIAAFAVGAAQAAPTLRYKSLEAETATEYQVGDSQLGPSYLRLIARGEWALSDSLTAKATVSPCGGSYSTHPKGVTQCAVYRLVEEFTLNGDYSRFNFSVGRQVITQGNTEGFILLDRFNGRDYCRFARLDVQNKLPNWLAQGRASFSESTSLAVTFAPFSPVSYLPQTGSYCEDSYHNLGRFDGLHEPGNSSIADWGGGLELATKHDQWSAGLNVMTVTEDIFVLETVPTLEKTRPRTLWLGGTAAATLGGKIVLRGEVAFAPNRMFTLDPSVLGGLLARGSTTNGTDGRRELLAAVGVEGSADEWFWAVQYFQDRIERGPRLVQNNDGHFMSLRLRRSFMNDRLAFESFAVYDIDYSDVALRASVSYEINDATAVTVGGTAYSDIDNNTGLFGSYSGRESLFLKFRRTFF